VAITFSGSPTAWFLASAGAPAEKGRNYVPYSHAEIVLSDGEGGFRLAGVSRGKVRRRPIGKALPEFSHMAIYRLRRPPHAGEPVARLVEKWLKDPVVREADFDYAFGSGESGTNKFYCLGFVNEAYRENGFPVPFPSPEKPHDSPALRQLAETFHAHVERTPLAGSLCDNPAYRRVLLWENALRSPEREWRSEQIARIGDGFYREGWRIKPRRYRFTSAVLALAGPLNDLPAETEAALAFKSGISEYLHRVYGAWGRLERRGKLDGLSEAERREWLECICRKYRDEFFERTNGEE